MVCALPPLLWLVGDGEKLTALTVAEGKAEGLNRINKSIPQPRLISDRSVSPSPVIGPASLRPHCRSDGSRSVGSASSLPVCLGSFSEGKKFDRSRTHGGHLSPETLNRKAVDDLHP